ncbi:hypothetical protein CF392_08490 [Tamilnaduibacter salinus]|uniref:Fatty acid hydroxylase domain-containing protein n=1 Tax=Tamilnaduibacter salinus TaxID=1484056 RepID=A0A2A2I3P0_9GAMM|nr:hypothetical protein CF392_08490 [Tamilnaduibacter salinus]
MVVIVEHLNALLSFYEDPWFWQYPAATLGLSVLAFLVFAAPWTLLAYYDPDWAKPFKIQQKPFQVRRYFWPNLARIAINSSIMFLLLIVSWPILRYSPIHQGELPAWYIIVLQLLFFIILDDFLYYWMHRYMHQNKWLLKNVHSVHHRIRNTCALDGNYFNWLEFVMTGSLALVGPLLLGCHLYVLYIWIVIRQLEAADGHAGYDFKWNPTHWLPVYQGPVYHDFHHARYQGNYAGFLPYLDRFWNTYVPEYLRYRRAKQAKVTQTVGR